MDKAQQRLAAGIAVIDVHILGESDQRLILVIDTMPDLHPSSRYVILAVTV